MIFFLIFLFVFFLGTVQVLSSTENNNQQTRTRLVSTCPAITEILFYLGVGDQLVGISKFCNFPEATKNITVVGDMNLNIEKLLQVQPELLLVMKDFRSGEVPLLDSLNLPFLLLDLSTLKGIEETWKILGKRFNRQNESDLFVQQLRSLTQTSTSNKPPKVYIETWGNPIMSVGGTSFISQLVSAAGGKNIFAEQNAANFEVSTESLLLKNPQMILLLHNTNTIEVALRPAFGEINAVKTGKINQIHPDLIVRPGPRILDGLMQLKELLKP
jgi:iron complex transport system substrate-binding protein